MFLYRRLSPVYPHAPEQFEVHTADRVTYYFDRFRKIQRITSPRGAIAFERTAGALLIRDSGGRQVELRAQQANFSSAMDAQGRVWSFMYDGATPEARLVEICDPLQRRWRFEYDAGNRLVREVLPNGVAWVCEYGQESGAATRVIRDLAGATFSKAVSPATRT